MHPKVKVKTNLKVPRLDLDREVGVAAKYVVDDIRAHMHAEKGLDERSLPPRSKEYEKWKVKHGFGSAKMQLHKILINALGVRKPRTNARVVYVKPVREEVGKKLIEQGNNWFGISDRAEGRIIVYITNRIMRILKYGK